MFAWACKNVHFAMHGPEKKVHLEAAHEHDHSESFHTDERQEGPIAGLESMACLELEEQQVPTPTFDQ